MPHFRIEYSANLSNKFNASEFCGVMHKAILETGMFELGAVRVRAFKAEAFAIADQLPDNAFIDMNFKVGEGRTPEQLKHAGEHVFAAAREYLAPLFTTPHFALSFQIEVINASLSWKNNAMHSRLR
jgi:5-carboxymethyl-2-hydroxymuconate isomerase